MLTEILSAPLSLLRVCADVVYPRVCHSCRAELPPGAHAACRECLEAIVPVEEWDEAYRAALRFLREEGAVQDFVAAWYFEREGTLRALMHALKYGGFTQVGEEFGRALGERILDAGLGGADIVVPLPLHASRSRERGFNQCEYIARGVSSVTGRPSHAGMLRRTRFTQSQTALGSAERRENVRDAFALRVRARPLIEGRTVLLVDDVVTTGSTMRSCAAVLRAGGARSVIACAVAIAR